MNEPVHVDRALARRILDGDERAFRGLFDDYFPRLYRFALVRLRGDHEAASDVVQQTFCKAIERLDSYRGEAALYTWVCQICRNAIHDHCRRRNVADRYLLPLEDRPDLRAVLETISSPAIDRPDVAAWQADVHRLIQTTMDALPPRYGDVLEWKYIDGMPVAEIAHRLEIGPKAAESLLTRARVAFRSAMVEMAAAPDGLQPPQST
jgi:RNA polymerase sigma-70 factor, ECF subfamily